MKRALVIVLAICLSLGMFAGCGSKDEQSGKDQQSGTTAAVGSTTAAGGTTAVKSDMPDYLNAEEFPITKDKITLKMMGSKNPLNGEWKDMEVFKRMEALTNIGFEFDTPLATGYVERKSLVFAGGDLPDVFLKGAITIQDEESFGSEMLQPLEEYIEKYAPHIKKVLEENPEVKNAITATDGHIYTLPYIVRTKTAARNTMYMNTDWLQKVGMKIPATVDEFYQVLKAFKEKDPNGNNTADEIALSYYKEASPAASAAGLPSILDAIIYAAFSGQAGGSGFDIKDGKVTYNPIQPSFKEYLAYMNKLYTEKLLDPEMFTQTQQQFTSKYKEGKMGISVLSLATVLNPGDPAPYEILPPMTSSLNSKQVTAELPGIYTGEFAISKNCKYPEAMIRWADVFYRTDDESVEGISGLSTFLGIYDFNWHYTDSTKKTYIRESKIADVNPSDYIIKAVVPGGFGWVATDAVADGDPLLLLKATESVKSYFPYTVSVYPTTVRFDKEQSDRLTFLQGDINTYIEQMVAKFIIGAESLDNWDAYVNKLKQMNIDELTQIRQEAYDRWNKK